MRANKTLIKCDKKIIDFSLLDDIPEKIVCALFLNFYKVDNK